MGTTQTVFGLAIVSLLLGLGLYYAWQQRQTLRGLRDASEMEPEEHAFLRNQAWRRLAGSFLMFVLAGLFIGVFFLEGRAAGLVAIGEELRQADAQRELDPDEKNFVRFYGGYVVVLLLVLMGMIGLAGYEFFAIRRFSVLHLKRIQSDRRAMIAREAARMRASREDRNGL